GLGNVGAIITHFHAEFFLHPCALVLDGCRVAEAIQHDLRAFGGKRAGHAKADAARGTGDDGGFPFEAHAELLLKLERQRTLALKLFNAAWRKPSTPGKARPSSHSKKAPPAMDT